MTRLEKKCFLFSAGLHGLLLVILVGTSAFREKPATKDIPILTMIPARILDEAGAAGGSPAPAAAAPQPAPAVPTPVRAPPVVRPQPISQPRAAEPVERPKPREVEKKPEPETELPAREEAVRPVKKRPTHEIVVDHTEYTPAKSSSRTRPKTSAATEESASRTEARRLRAIAESLDNLASNVRNSGAKGTVVDMPGQGGGEAFAGYETVIYNAYYHAWITPDSVANKLAGADVKIVVARDGSIISAEIVNKSGEPGLNKSVERALRAVTRLPAFPAGAHDEQRSFLIRFSLEAKEGSG